MSPGMGNGYGGWHLTVSIALLRRLREFGDMIGVPFTSALRFVRRRLTTDPEVFGEPLYRLKGKPGEVRHAAIAPLALTFAVYPEDRLVWIVNAWLLSLPDELS